MSFTNLNTQRKNIEISSFYGRSIGGKTFFFKKCFKEKWPERPNVNQRDSMGLQIDAFSILFYVGNNRDLGQVDIFSQKA